MTKTFLLFLIIFIEGYVVLACELLAIRELIPFVGSGTETISIVISAVLLPLAVGYHWGGRAYRHHRAGARHKGSKARSVRKLLLRNMLVALLILTPGLSYVVMERFFNLLDWAGVTHRLAQTPLYSLLFLVVPMFLLGQTVPLVSNYFSSRRLSEITGWMLFISTIGAFLGSVFSTIVLMMAIGVHKTVIVTLGLLALLVILLAKRARYERIAGIALLGVIFLLNGDYVMAGRHIVSNNAYNTISITDAPDGTKLFMVNRSIASRIGPNNETYDYVKYLESMVLNYDYQSARPRDILVIGAGGFTFGHSDFYNSYTYVDIDPAIKKAAEGHFLHQRLGRNKTFAPVAARAFIRNHDRAYDMILVDVYTNAQSMPMECTTREFLLDLKKLLKPDGMLAVHAGVSPVFEDAFSIRYHNTFASVFPAYTRQVMGAYNPWPDGKRPPQMNIVLYLYFNRALSEDRGIYTDDKNSYSLDRP